MKKKQLLLILLFASTLTVSYGQEDIKEWKTKLKQLTPEQYKKLIEENENLKKEASDSKTETEHFKSEAMSKDAEIAKLQQEVTEAKAQAAAAPPQTPVNPTPVVSAPVVKTVDKPKHTASSSSGVLYKVQIGYFKNKNLEKYINNTKNFSGDVDEDGARKYTLGEFSDYWEADNFKKYLREMGVKDAWIVSYKNGKRVPIKDALEGSL